MELKDTKVCNIDGAIRSMRMPMMSHNKSDSYMDSNGDYIIGEADMKLAQNLIKGGSEHSKFLRTIYVDVVIIAPIYVASEIDTYKIGTVRNSSSIMHKGASRDFTINDFTWDGDVEELQSDIDKVNYYRKLYVETKDYKYFRMMRQKLPSGYNYTFSFSTSYAELRNMWLQRVKNPHRLKEWTEDFAKWIDSLPYADELIKI